MREIAEQREERLLGQIQSQMAQSRQALVDLARQREGVIHQQERALTQTTSAVELIDTYAQLQVIRNLEATAAEQLSKLGVLQAQQMKIYQAANRNSEMLCGMRDKQRDEFYQQLMKREQSVLDDNFSSRRHLS